MNPVAYDVKVVRFSKVGPGGEIVEGEESFTVSCPGYGVKTVFPGSLAHTKFGTPVGVHVELEPWEKGGEIRKIHLPTDGDRIFVMKGPNGVTIDSKAWPPRAPKPNPAVR